MNRGAARAEPSPLGEQGYDTLFCNPLHPEWLGFGGGEGLCIIFPSV